MTRTRFFLAVSTAMLLSNGGCVHRMQVRNLQEFQLTAHSPTRHTVRITAPTSGPGQPYGEMIQDSLSKHASVVSVVRAADPVYDRKPDVDVRADVTVKYRGSGLNFPITFPGFLLFTHAWNGYIYKADIVTNLSVTSVATGQTRARTLSTSYDMRHCDFGRGFWSSSGWFLPGWGATSLLAGAFMVSYDTDATPEFSKAVHDAYGGYVANNVAEMLTEVEDAPRAPVGPAAAAAPREAEPVKVAVAKPVALPVEVKPARGAKTGPAADPVRAASPPPATRAASTPGKTSSEDDDAYNDRVWKEQANSQQ